MGSASYFISVADDLNHTDADDICLSLQYQSPFFIILSFYFPVRSDTAPKNKHAATFKPAVTEL